jgi:hypothetical protein
MTNPHQDATASALAAVIAEKSDGDTLISAQSLVKALSTLGIPVALKGLTSEASGDTEASCMYFGMSQVIALLMDGLDVAIAREELERL